jgi:hypothetical protein
MVVQGAESQTYIIVKGKLFLRTRSGKLKPIHNKKPLVKVNNPPPDDNYISASNWVMGGLSN